MILHKVEIKLIQQHDVDCGHGDTCAGFFDDNPKPVFVCALGIAQREWIPVFIHEYCHFLQWKDQCKEWKNYQKLDKNELLDKWMAEEIELSHDKVKKLCRAMREVELDCEKRAVEVIQRFDLEFDVEDYIRKANAYVLYFNLLPDKGGWFTKENPSNVNQITKALSPRFLKSYARTPKKYIELVNKYCF